MKTLYLISSLLLLACTSFAQLDTVIYSPSVISNGDYINIRVKLKDFPAGIKSMSGSLSNKNDQQKRALHNWYVHSDSVYSNEVKISDYALSGTWKLDYLLVVDSLSNHTRFTYGTDYTNGFTVNSNQQDSLAPVLQSFSIYPEKVRRGDTLTVRIELDEDLSGVSGVDGLANVPDGNMIQSRLAHRFRPQHELGNTIDVYRWERVAPNTYESKRRVPLDVNLGVWKVLYFLSVDVAGNKERYENIEHNFEIVLDNSIEQHAQNTLRVYPNPAHDVLNFSPEVVRVECYNALNQCVKSQVVSNNRMDISALAPGTYFVQLHTKTSQSIVKLIKR